MRSLLATVCMGCVSAKSTRNGQTRPLARSHSGGASFSKMDSLPRDLASHPRGIFQSHLPPIDEGRRDFARIFFANERKIFFIGKGMQIRPLQPTAGPSSAHIGDFSDAVMDRAEALFGEALFAQLAQVRIAGGHQPLSTEELIKLRSRAVQAMTVNVGIDFALHMKLLPTFLQPFFLIIAMDSPLEARAATYGFVAQTPTQISGDRPDSKRSPFCVRLLSPDLLAPSCCTEDTAPHGWEVQYHVREVRHSTATIMQAVEEELQNLKDATRASSWDLL